MKHKVSLVAILMMALTIPFWARASYTFTAIAPGGQTLYYTLSYGDAVVTYPGTQPDNPWNGFEKPTGSLIIPDSVVSNGIWYPVTRINESAFAGCTGLTSVAIGSNVSQIGSNYSHNSWNSYLGAFSGCTSLENVVMPNRPINILYASFFNCTSLSAIDLSHADVIGYYSFSHCNALTEANLLSATVVYPYAFYECISLASVTLGNGLTTIGTQAFWGCTSLVSIEVPISVQQIGANAFSGIINVIYTGGATGSPWGASYVNAYAENGVLYTNNQKNVLIAVVGGTSVTIEPTVTQILPNAFTHCDSLTTLYFNAVACASASGCELNSSELLTNVVFGDNVTSIPSGLCLSCTGLTSVQLPDAISIIGDYAFYGCSGLTSINLPDSLYFIGDYAFYGCTGLAQISIGHNVQQIGNAAFAGCNITSVTYDAEECYTNGGGIFGTSVSSLTLGNHVRIIPDYAFDGCAGLSSVSFPPSLQSIGAYAFAGCIQLHSPALGDSLSSIGAAAFAGCQAITAITIPNQVVSIGVGAFSGCSALATVNYNAVACLSGNSAFDGCTALSTLNIGAGVRSIPANAFRNCTGLVSLTLPDGIETVGTGAFEGCINLTSANLGNGLTAVPGRMFYGCLRLTSVRLGDAVASIGNYAFKDCGIIGELVIPQSIITIGSGAFSECYGINEITALGRVAPLLGDYAFSGVDSNIVVNVPCNTTNLYAGRWPQFHNFNEIPFLFNAISENLSKGTVSVTQEPTCSEPQAVVQATPKTGYRFDHWSDGSTDNPYTYTVTGSGTLIAYFASTTAISDTETEEASIEIRDGVISVHGVQPTEVQVYNMAGCLVNHRARLAAGIYVVRIGQSVGKKIVVL